MEGCGKGKGFHKRGKRDKLNGYRYRRPATAFHPLRQHPSGMEGSKRTDEDLGHETPTPAGWGAPHVRPVLPFSPAAGPGGPCL
jgi:hypothetical protein